VLFPPDLDDAVIFESADRHGDRRWSKPGLQFGHPAAGALQQ
jgi:hypothetical protein